MIDYFVCLEHFHLVSQCLYFYKMEALENCFLILHAELPQHLQNLTLRGAVCARMFAMVCCFKQGARDLALLTFPLLTMWLQLPNGPVLH